jgi:hypothetical protein
MYNPITNTEIENELNSRGYFRATPAQPTPPGPVVPPVIPPTPVPPEGLAALLENKVFMSILIGTILTFFE